MAKVMISIPDELLRSFDAYVHRRGTTRSGQLQELVVRELRTDMRRHAVRKVLESASPHGGESARHVRELRRAH